MSMKRGESRRRPLENSTRISVGILKQGSSSFSKLVKQKGKARTGINPKTLKKIKIPATTVVKFRVAKVAKDAILGTKK